MKHPQPVRALIIAGLVMASIVFVALTHAGVR
jgi:hypothetical protein